VHTRASRREVPEASFGVSLPGVQVRVADRWDRVAAYPGALKAGAVVNPVNVVLTPRNWPM
jgi:hypothetical protein